jgi:SpoIID/LytB domain protein
MVVSTSNKITLISLIKDNSVFVNHAQNRIFGSVSKIFPDTGAFEVFEDAKEMLGVLSKAFSHSKAVVVCAEPPHYLHLKKLLLRALSIESETSESIRSAIKEFVPDCSEVTAEAHSLMPKDATLFVSEDGLFSGFAVKSGKQHLIVLPLDLDRVDGILAHGFETYIKSVLLGADLSTEAPVAKDSIANTLQRFAAENLSVAVAANKPSAFIKMKLASAGEWEDLIKFAACDENKKEMTQKEYIAGIARQAREDTESSVGVAISNVFSSEKENGSMFVLVTVADALRARVAKVYAQADESPKQLVLAAVDTLFGMVNEYIDAGGFDGFPVNENEPDFPEEEIKGRSRIAFKLILSVVMAIIFSLVLIFFGGDLVNAVRDFAGKGASAGALLTDKKSTSAPQLTTSSSDGLGLSPDELLSILAEMSSYAATVDESTAETETDSSSSAAVSTTVKGTTKPSATIKTTTKTTAKTTVISTKPSTTKSSTTGTTTKPQTTTTTTTTTSVSPTQYAGTFAFTVKGYGHGVGMSQEGAKKYAADGWKYDAILLHYYQPGVTVLTDSNMPSHVSYNGTSYELKEYLARTVAAEIGTSNQTHEEAYKAQTVAAYTFAKRYNYVLNSNHHAFSTSFNMDPNSKVVKAVVAVAGKYLSYNGSAAVTFYFASAAGQTVSSASVWGSSIPYLGGGISSPETVAVSNRSYTANDLKVIVNNYNLTCGEAKKITLQENPADWIEIINKDSAGYINTIRVGNRTMTGYTFRYSLLKLGIKSHCFTLNYTPA